MRFHVEYTRTEYNSDGSTTLRGVALLCPCLADAVDVACAVSAAPLAAAVRIIGAAGAVLARFENGRMVAPAVRA